MYELLPVRSLRLSGLRVVSLCPVPICGALPFADDAAPAGISTTSIITLIHHGDRASAEQFAQELLLSALAESGYNPDISVQPLRRLKYQIQIRFFEEMSDEIHSILAPYRPRLAV